MAELYLIEIGLRAMSMDLSNDKLILVQVMSWRVKKQVIKS